MATFDVPGPIKNLLPGALDSWRGPYATVADACNAIANVVVGGRNFREGKIVDIGVEPNTTPHAWKGGFSDVNLVKLNKSDYFGPYNSNAEALAAVPVSQRWGTSVGITTSDGVIEKWWPNINSPLTIKSDFSKIALIGKNKANKETFAGKIWQPVGTWSDSATYFSTPLIPSPEGQVWTASGHRNNSASLNRVIFFDANGAPIGTPIKGNGTSTTTFTVPTGAISFGINISDSLDGGTPQNNTWANTFQLELGATATAYEPYYKGVDVNKLVGSLPYVGLTHFNEVKAQQDKWKIAGSQLINKNLITPGYYQTSGAIASGTSSPNWRKILVAVSPNTKYTLTIPQPGLTFFGNEYTTSAPSAMSLVGAIPGTSKTQRTFTTGPNTYYLGINISNTGDLDYNTLMLNVGGPLDFEPFGATFIDGSQVKNLKIPSTASPSSVDSSRLYIEKTATNFDIYMHQYDDVYLRQRYSRYTKAYVSGAVSFYDIWKLGELRKFTISDGVYSGLYQIVDHSTEWETAIEIDGSNVSGQQHGYEQKLSNVFLIDGSIISEDFVGNFWCSKVEFVQRNHLFKFNSTSSPAFSKNVSWEITRNAIKMDIALSSITANNIDGRMYMGMFAAAKTYTDPVTGVVIPITTTGFNDASYYLNDVNAIEADGKLTIGEGNNNADTMRLWKQGPEFGGNLHVTYLKDKFANHKLFANQGGKIYNVYTSNYQTTPGEMFRTKVEIKYSLKKS